MADASSAGTYDFLGRKIAVETSLGPGCGLAPDGSAIVSSGEKRSRSEREGCETLRFMQEDTRRMSSGLDRATSRGFQNVSP